MVAGNPHDTFRIHQRWLRFAAAIAIGTSVVAACSGSSGAGAVTISMYTPPDSSGATGQAAANCSAASGGRYRIVWNQLPSAADGQRSELVRRLAAHDHSLDILAMDVTWEPEFAEARWISPWTGQDAAQARADTLAGPLQTATWKGQLVAATWNTNTQLLWYRSDLVPHVPATWDEMIQDSLALAKAGKPHYIEEQGAQYEGLTVWFNSLVTSAGGSILNTADTQPALGTPAAKALQTMHDLAHSSAADPSLSNAKEDDARLAMESGSAAFEINYPFVYPSMKSNKPDLFKNFKWAPFPAIAAGQQGKSTIGGLDLGVSAFSRHQDAAFQAALCLRDRPNQELLAVEGGLPPTLRSIYTSPTPDFVKAYPFYKEILTAVDGGAVRPQTPAYQNISIVLSHTLSPPSSINPPSALATLRSQISDALQSKGLIP